MHLPSDHPKDVERAVGRPLAFTAQGDGDLDRWAEALRAKLVDLLRFESLSAYASTGVPQADVASTDQCDGFTRDKVYIDAGALGPIPAFVLTPDSVSAAAPTTAILCLHGHGGYYAGKDMVAGTTDTHPIAVECGEALNYGYGVQLAREGYVTICPDAYGWGERMREADRWTTEHACSMYHDLATKLGFSHLGITTWSNRRVIDYVTSLPQVQGDRVGCIGLSYGGVQALTISGVDTRVAATVVSGSLSTAEPPPGSSGDDCGATKLPGMLAWFDRPDVAISLAPRPVLFEFMKQDSCLEFDRAWKLYEHVRDGYTKRGAADAIHVDTADTDHRYIGDKVPAFFERALRGETAASA